MTNYRSYIIDDLRYFIIIIHWMLFILPNRNRVHEDTDINCSSDWNKEIPRYIYKKEGHELPMNLQE